MTIEYTAMLTLDDGGRYTAEFPDLPGCITFGETIEHALEMARDAREGWLAVHLTESAPVPTPTEAHGAMGYPIRPRASVAVPVWLRRQRERRGLTQAEIAMRLGVSQPAYAKYERVGASNLRLSTIEKLQKVFGESIVCV